VKVQDLITSNVKSCRPETSLAAAAVDMWENDCGALPVVDGEGKVIGLITDRDIAIAVGTLPFGNCHFGFVPDAVHVPAEPTRPEEKTIIINFLFTTCI